MTSNLRFPVLCAFVSIGLLKVSTVRAQEPALAPPPASEPPQLPSGAPSAADPTFAPAPLPRRPEQPATLPPSAPPPSRPPSPSPVARGPLVWNATPGVARDTVAPPAPQKPSSNALAGFLDFNAYPYLSDVKADSVFTLNASAKLPYGFAYFSLTNVMNQDGASPFEDTNGFYTEQNLRWSFPAPVPVDLTFQYNMRGGLDNDRWRFGFRYRLDGTPGLDRVMKAIALTYSANFHVLQLDDDPGYVWQIEHVARLDTPYLDRRVYVAGFMDHTFNQGYDGIPENPIVLEVQGGIRAIEELYAVAEYRVNQYRKNQESNVALGAEYVVKW